MRMDPTIIREMMELGILEIDDDTKIQKSVHYKGREYPNPKPMALKVGFRKPETLAQEVARLMRSSQMLRDLQNQGYETIDDANDFEMDDELVPLTPYEIQSMQNEYFEGEDRSIRPNQDVTDPPEGKGVGTAGDSIEDPGPGSGE